MMTTKEAVSALSLIFTGGKVEMEELNKAWEAWSLYKQVEFAVDDLCNIYGFENVMKAFEDVKNIKGGGIK